MLNTTIRSLRDTRYWGLVYLTGFFVLLSFLTRLGLVVTSGELLNQSFLNTFSVFAIGLLYDLGAVAYVIAIAGLVAALVPDGLFGRRFHGMLLLIGWPALVFGALFVATAEFLFWNEFSSRFNFIAVDYLVYTREVIGNIRESYSAGWIFTALGCLTVIISVFTVKPVWWAARAAAGNWRRRCGVGLLCLMVPIGSFYALSDSPRLLIENSVARELAGNGYYDFMRAFRNNDLDFKTFYATLPDYEAESANLAEFEKAQTSAVFSSQTGVINRRYIGRENSSRLNVVLVTMESMGAEYVGALGGKRGLTPVLDGLSEQSLFFTATYATGLRTVRGLEAVTLSIPPLPGHAIPARRDNKNFQTLGSVLRSKGYDTIYLYGGYAHFDNMKDFFGGNGYEVIDRTDIPRENISHETIWGVADEDLLGHAIKTFDARYALGKRFFGHVMTTSNHRPFTFPSGRIDIASGTGREGAVRYADWAIGDFLQKAAARPWFNDTVFVFIADHTSLGRGRVDLDPRNFHIPFLIYSPQHVTPKKIHYVNSQIDLPPTVLALLGVGYDSQFFGQDILTEGVHHQRAFMANYLTVGYLEGGKLVQLMPNRRKTVVDATSFSVLESATMGVEPLVREAISHYQFAANWLKIRPQIQQ